MEPNVNYTIVGAFVILLLTAIILSVIWLSSGFSFKVQTLYKVYMHESVSGLNPDSAVEFNGVDVGSIGSIQLDPKNSQLVELLLKIKSTTRITQGTVAMLSTRGMTGATFIALSDKGQDQRPLLVEPGQRYPVIKTTSSIFLRLEAALTQFTNNFHQISDSIHSLLDQQNLQSIKDSLKNIKQVTGTLAMDSEKLDSIIQNSMAAMRTLETQTLPAANHLLFNLDDVVRTLSDVSKELKQNPSILIRGVNRSAELGPGEKK